MPKSIATLQTFSVWFVSISLGLLPLFFLAVTQDYYDFNKWMLLVFTSLTVFVLWIVRSVSTGSYVIRKNAGSLALAVLSFASLVSLLFSSANKVEAFLSPFGLGTLLSLTILLGLGATFFDKNSKRILRYFLIGSAGLLGIIAVYQFFGLGNALFPTLSFFKDPSWTPVGSAIGLVLVLAFLLPISIQAFLDALREKKEAALALIAISGILITAGLAVSLYQLVPKLGTTLMPFSVGWTVLLESFKSVNQAAFGVGSENFLSAFTQSRPVAMNIGNFWNVRFTISASFIFHVLTTLGALGGVGLLLLLRSLLMPLRISLVIIVISLFLLPPNLTALTILVAVLLLSDDHEKELRLHVSQRRSWLHSGPVVFAGALVIVTIYALGLVYAAEMAYYQSLLTLRQNQGTPTYNLQIRANQLNPNVSRFHVALSQTSLALADAMLSQALASQSGIAKQNLSLSDSDRQIVTQLIQQSIREAKIGVNLAPRAVTSWENLASIYESISRVATGADQWTVATYQQAIVLDPTNPILRLRLGGIYVAVNNFEGARQQYQVAASLKPDYANAHYNLAFVLRQEKQYLAAAVEFKTTKSLVQIGSDDEQKVTAELADLTKLLTPQEKDLLDQQSPSNPSYPPTPSQILSPVSEPQIQLSPRLSLPEEASPSPLLQR